MAIIPTVLLGPVEDAYVDRWNRRLTILIADAFIALMSLLFAYFFWTGNMQAWRVCLVIEARAGGGFRVLRLELHSLPRPVSSRAV